MGSGPRIAKLRKSIKKGSVDEIVNAMFNLNHREDKAKTVGENILFQTNRAVTALNSGNPTDMPPKVKMALARARVLADFIWDKDPAQASAAIKAKAEEKSPEAKAPEAKTEALEEKLVETSKTIVENTETK